MDRAWAWWNGVSYDNADVIQAINTAFEGVDLQDLKLEKKDLEDFRRNLATLNRKLTGAPSDLRKTIASVYLFILYHPSTQVELKDHADLRSRGPYRRRKNKGKGARKMVTTEAAAAPPPADRELGREDVELVKKYLGAMVGNPQLVETFTAQAFAVGQKYSEDIALTLSLVHSLGKPDGKKYMTTIMKYPPQVKAFFRILTAIWKAENAPPVPSLPPILREAAPLSEDMGLGREDVGLIENYLGGMVGNPHLMEDFTTQAFSMDPGCYTEFSEDVGLTLGLVHSLGKPDGGKFMTTIMENPSQVKAFFRILTAIWEAESADKAAARKGRGVVEIQKPKQLLEWAKVYYKGVFDKKRSQSYTVLKNSLERIQKEYPCLLEIHGDNDCFYKAIATLQYVKERSAENLTMYQDQFVKMARERVAAFLKDPERLTEIPKELVDASFPDEGELQGFIRAGALSKRNAIDTYGGMTRKDMLKTISTPKAKAASGLEMYVLSLIFGEFFDVTVSCSLRSKEPAVRSILYPNDNSKLPDADKLLQNSKHWRAPKKGLAAFGFPLMTVVGHFHLALTNEAARFINSH